MTIDQYPSITEEKDYGCFWFFIGVIAIFTVLVLSGLIRIDSSSSPPQFKEATDQVGTLQAIHLAPAVAERSDQVYSQVETSQGYLFTLSGAISGKRGTQVLRSRDGKTLWVSDGHFYYAHEIAP